MNKKITILIMFVLLFTSFLNVKAEGNFEISDIQVPTSLIRPTTATITWTTNFPSSSEVSYWSVDGTQKNYNWDKVDDYTQTSHIIELKDLKAFTTYNFTVSSKRQTDPAKITSEQGSFTTTADTQITDINNSAKSLNDGKISELLSEIKLLRDQLREQAAELKYLKTFATEMRALNANMQTAIKAFIAYGVDDNTKKLGEGERAAVISSYEAAFDKLPQTEAELADAIKIANGRFPSITNDKAEQRAKEQFLKIYKRIADMNDAKDAAAVKVMAYGLRQKAQNRNLNSEKTGINTFKNIFGSTPKTTEDWNTMQAIAYSGATRKTDSDKDSLADETEKKLGTNPNNADSDGDGYKDGAEVLKGYNPLKK